MTLAPPRVELGAPGVYVLPQVSPPVLGAEPLDVSAFVGVAPRGPAWEVVDDPTLLDLGISRARSVAVGVDSWDDYVERFGAFEGPGLLPHAVAAYFAQGARRAVIVRIVHDEISRTATGVTPLGCAHLDLVDSGRPLGAQVVVDTDGALLRVRARNEGTWGNRLEVRLSFTTRPVAFRSVEPAAIVLDRGATLPVGSLVRLRAADGTTLLRWVRSVESRGLTDRPEVVDVATLDVPVAFTAARIDEVDVAIDILDRDPLRLRRERFDRIGLRPGHPRWLTDVLRSESRLVEAVEPLAGVDVLDVTLPPLESRVVPGLEGHDRWDLVTPEDVFGRILLGDESGTEGLDALLTAPEVATVVVPDLYSPAPLAGLEPVELAGSFAGPDFAPCVAVPPERHAPPTTSELIGLFLDPRQASHLDRIVQLQQELVRIGERLRCLVLLDVPPGLRRPAILRWRSRFDSSWVAAYHPWLRCPTGDPLGPLVDVNPSAAAAGIIARCERRQGVPRGPANEPVAWAVAVTVPVDDDEHAELHQQGIDVLRQEPDAVRLTGARTLSVDRAIRQVSVRRLLQLIERAVSRQLEWTVFEPNDERLRAGLRRMIDHLLGDLFARGAFAGATPAQSWFVHVAEGRDVGLEADRGQLVVEIGIAPSEPTEFILVRVALDTDGTLDVQSWLSAGVTIDG